MAQAYRVPVLERFAWQEPVLATVDAPLLTAKGTRYLVSATPSGDFIGHANTIAWMDDSGWKYDTGLIGWKVYDIDSLQFFVFDGALWSSASVFNGITLTGDVTSDETAIDWDLLPNDPSALSFDSPDKVGILNFDTTTGSEVLSTTADLKIDGDLDLTDKATDIALANATDALTISYDSTSIITVDSTNLRTSFDKDVVIVGDLTVQGATTTIETSQLVVEDKLITLNKGGVGGATAGGSGLEFEYDAGIVGYMKTSADGNDFVFNSPANANVLTLDIDADTTLNMQGNLTVETEGGTINQDLTTDSTSVEFAGLKLTGGVDLTDAGAGAITLTDNDVAAFDIGGVFKIDTTTGAKSVDITGKLDVTGVATFHDNIELPNAIKTLLAQDEASALSFDSSSLVGIMSIDTTAGAESVDFAGDLDVAGDASVTGDINVSPASTFTDGTAAATAAEMQTSYDGRAQFDDVLKVLRFVDPDIYVAA